MPMPLNTIIVKKRLASAPWKQKDNEAQNIINGATSSELKSLDAEGVLRLYEALVMLYPTVYSARDKAAMKKLATNTQFQPVKNTPDFGVNLVKRARLSQPNIQSQLTPGLVTRIYVAEKKRLDCFERLGFDGSTVGRGQLGQPAYMDVKKPVHFKTALETCLTRVFLARLLNSSQPSGASVLGFDMKNYRVKIPVYYSSVWHDGLLKTDFRPLEDFVVAAYLAIRITAATKSGRSSKDTARFAVALYHGMRDMVVAAQTSVKDKINWVPVEAELLKKGYTDAVAYVKEVVK
jgi:hypothetical protein